MQRNANRARKYDNARGLLSGSGNAGRPTVHFLALAILFLGCASSDATGAPASVPAPAPDLKGAHYCHISGDERWETDSRTGPYADLMVDFQEKRRKFVFWRGSSYLPYWQTEQGKWFIEEVVPRSGDGSALRPDRVCQYSHVRLIEASPARVIVHWRYVPDFNDPGMDGWVDEYFTIYPDGVCVRSIRKPAASLLGWLDPNRLIVQYWKLEPDGIRTLPAPWRDEPELALADSSTRFFDNQGYDKTKRCYVLKCRRNELPAELDFTLGARGGKHIHDPVIVVKNWGDAGVKTSGDRLCVAGYSHQLSGTDLILWLGLESDGPVRLSVKPIHSGAPSANQPPVVIAGDDQSIVVAPSSNGPFTVHLHGLVKDDGLPKDELASAWSLVSGAAPVGFADAHAPVTALSLSKVGAYRLRLTASDGLLSSSNDVIIQLRQYQVTPGSPAARWKFDETMGETTEESITHTACFIAGPKVFRKAGVIGSALEFDGYHSAVSLPESRVPKITNGLTVEAWVALGARPWNWAPIVQQSNWKSAGYYLGVDAYGHVGLKLAVGGKWETLTSTATLKPYHWTHVAGTFDKATGKMRIYINGRAASELSVPHEKMTAAKRDLLIGMNNSKIQPTDAVRPKATFPAIYGFDGLIDEVRIYARALSPEEVSRTFTATVPGALVQDHPDMQQRILPSGPAGLHRFGAFYTKLRYYETWDDLWRVSEDPDILVKFDEAPVTVVFWRGTSYGPGWVTENNRWMCNQSVEEGGGGTIGCCEHMSDKQCRHSCVRIIENNDARVVIHWRYALVDVLYDKPRLDKQTGWSDWVDEYYTIYPDGVGVRHIFYWSSSYGHYSPHSTQFLSGPGTRPEDNVSLNAVTLVAQDGRTRTLSWSNGIPNNTLPEADADVVNFKSEYKAFEIFPPGIKLNFSGGSEMDGYSHWPTWNHWPVAQIPSDGRKATSSDRVTHSGLGEADVDSIRRKFPGECAFLNGLWNKPAADLAVLARSWNQAPPIVDTSAGLIDEGYDRFQRAYILGLDSGERKQWTFTVRCSNDSPMVNPCFVFRDWRPGGHVSVRINGQPVAPGPAFRQGIERSTGNGVASLVIWIQRTSVSPVNITVSKSSQLN